MIESICHMEGPAMKRTRYGIFKKPFTMVTLALCIIYCNVSFVYAQVPVMLGLGDSLGEGVQSADASFRTQPYSYLSVLARRIGIPFPLPWIWSSYLGVVGDTSNRSRIYPSMGAWNLSVSGTDVNSLINERADATTPEEINSETDLVLFPQRGSQVEIAEALGSFLTVCWIGSNDVLSSVLSFDNLDASQLTPPDEFEADFTEIAQRLTKSATIVVFANIPDVTKTGFLLDRQDLTHFVGSDYGLGEGEYTSIVAMFLIRLGLDDGSLIQNPNFVLDRDEIQQIQDRTATLNGIIAKVASNVGMPVVDIHALFEEITNHPPVLGGIPLTHHYLGGIFSLDGVHPSNIGHALIANAFIQTINSRYSASIPPVSGAEFLQLFLTDPFVDKDGDGLVTGRPGAGLLESLGPSLGISGDPDDSIVTMSPSGSVSLQRKKFIQHFQKEWGSGPGWSQKDSVKAFKEILHLNGGL
jgi:hypothetical protein